jgi:hypothetical protein
MTGIPFSGDSFDHAIAQNTNTDLPSDRTAHMNYRRAPSARHVLHLLIQGTPF